MIKLEKINKSYKNNNLFKDCSFTFENGKKYLILGDNGVGKSVLLKMIVGYSKADSGKIMFDNETLGENFDFLPNSGVSINAPEFISSMTGLENLMEIAKIKKIASKDDILKLAQILNLDVTKKYKSYSLGMRQKMRIIQALMENPDYLILDEPFDALDKNMKEITKKLINDYLNIDRKRIVIFTSHDVQAIDFADIVLKIEEKKVIQVY